MDMDGDGDLSESKALLSTIGSDAAAAAEAEKKNGKTLLFSFIAMVFVGSGNKIFQKLATIPMQRYGGFIALWSTGVYLLSYIYIVINPGGVITPAMREIPKYRFAIMGALDSTAGIMQTFATVKIESGALLILLQQAAIPISMVISKLLAGAKYSVRHYVGAAIVAVGLLVVLLPSLLHPSGGAPIEWIAVMILSCVPMALSSVYKELAFDNGDEDELDIVFVNFWVAFFQLFVSFVLVFPAGYAAHIPPQEIPQNLWYGFRCYIGKNSIHTANAYYEADDCAMAPAYLNIYILFNLFFNVLILAIISVGSANILWLALTTLVPIANFAFALHFVPGHKPIKATDVIGLILIMIGLFIYRLLGMVLAWHNERRATLDAEEQLIANDDDVLSIRSSGSSSAMAINGGTSAGAYRSMLSVTPSISFTGSSLEVGLATGILAHRVRVRKSQERKLRRSHLQIRGGYFSRLGLPATHTPTDQGAIRKQ